jgi:molecular chaperone GrpE
MTDGPSAQPETVEKEKYLRLAADFENYKRSMEQQLASAVQYAAQPVVLAMVGVMDHYDQALTHATDAVRSQTEWYRGLEHTGREFHETMRKFGVERIISVGKPFDPALMEAVQMKPPDSTEHSGTVESELQAGYTLHGRVIRPARVVVYQ